MTSETAAYEAGLATVLLPLVRLMIAKGVTYPMVDRLLQRAYVQMALSHFVTEGDKATASRLYMLTGIHRKKIAPLLEPAAPTPEGRSRPLSIQVHDRITGDPTLLDRRGRPKPIPVSRREGGERSFEAIVEAISKDVRPRTVLDQWLHAGLATLDAKGRVVVTVEVNRSSYAPGDEAAGLERSLRPSLEALVNNLLKTGPRNGSSTVNVEGLRPAVAAELVAEMRQDLLDVMLRFNERAERRALYERQQGREGPCAVSVGVFDWIDGRPPPEAAAVEQPQSPAPAPAPRRRRRPA